MPPPSPSPSPSRRPSPRWISFDCYGTLIDWQSGVRRAFQEFAHAAAEETQEMFAAWERIQWEMIQGPYEPYEEILRSSFRRTVEDFGYWCPGYAGEAFVDSLARWEPFPDVNPALQRLSKNHHLAIISNIDRRLLGGTIKNFPVRFDALITAEDVLAYKPNPAIFRLALERMACRPDEAAHVAFGARYDLKAALELGMRVIFLNRDASKIAEDVVAADSVAADIVAPDAVAADAVAEAEIRSLEELPALWS